MTSFLLLSPIVRGLFSLWAIILCLGFASNGIYSLLLLRIKSGLCSFGLFIFPCLILRICEEVSDYYLIGKMSIDILFIAKLPFYIYILVFFILSVLCILRFYYTYQFVKTHITPKSIKEASDELKTGFVYYFKGGQVYMSNHQMNRLANELFDKQLINGESFSKLVFHNEIFETDDGTVWRFKKNELRLKNETMYEILAEDVTEIYRKNEKLRMDNMELRKNNLRMRRYGEQIDEIVKHEEILKAKVHIHDEMNRLLLVIGNTLTSKLYEERKNLLNEMQTNVLLLCMNAENQVENPLEDLYKIAESIGVKIHFNKEIKFRGETLLLFMISAQECMINAVKHADAKNFYIEITETNEEIVSVFKNDGKPPIGPVCEGGGLTGIRTRIEAAGGSMKILSGPKFTLIVRIKKEKISDEI